MKLYAETWDKMQDIMARYNDHMVHVSISFQNELDENAVKRAAEIVIDKIPVLKSRYYSGFFRAEWRVKGFNIDEIFEFESVKSCAEEASEKFLTGMIDAKREAQIKIKLIRCRGRDTLNFLINHQTLDGGDAKVFLKVFAEVYSDLVKGGSGDIAVKNGSRSDKQIYDAFGKDEMKEIGKLVSYSKKQKHKISFPFEKKGNTYPRIHKMIADDELFQSLKYKAKKLGVSFNDVILGAFYRVCLGMIALDKGATLGIPNMVNLRRYIPGGESAGFTNLTSMVVCNLGKDTGSNIFETVIKCKEAMDALKDNYPGLHGLALLEGVFKYTPHALAKFLIGTFFKNPLIGISNIGFISETELRFAGAEVISAYMTGSIKYPPYMQLALSTFRNKVTFTIANYGTDEDHEMLKEILFRLKKELIKFAFSEEYVLAA